MVRVTGRSVPGQSLAALLWLLGGCTWISATDVEGHKSSLDDDGDGYAAAEDCNDGDGEVFPGASEIWYNGVDEDCLGGDDYDQDGDGYVEDASVGLATAGVPGTGALPGGDCDDASPDTFPSAADAFYDGTDSDCAGNDDFDQDADGSVSNENIGRATEGIAGTGTLPGGDCDDEDIDVGPHMTDTWYDGVDTDCGGNSDFDQDGDGYTPDEYTDFETIYAEDIDALPAGDCDDLLAERNPGEVDTWYDALDSDCGLNDDFDQDGDGLVEDASSGLPTEDVEGTGLLPAGDCDDEDATAYPGAIETLADSADSDCDGGQDTMTFYGVEHYNDDYVSLTWSNPHDLVFAENSSSVFLSVATDESVIERGGSSSHFYDSALAIQWDRAAPADPATGLVSVIDWQRNLADPAFTLTAGHDILVTETDLYGATGIQAATSRSIRLGGYTFSTGKRYGVNYPVSTAIESRTAFEDIAVAQDSTGYLTAIGCESNTDVAQLIAGSPAEVAALTYNTADEYEGIEAAACELHFYDGSATTGTLLYGADDALQTDTWTTTADPPLFTEVDTETVIDPLAIDVPRDTPTGPWTIVADGNTNGIVIIQPGGVVTSMASGYTPVSVHAVWSAASAELVISFATQGGDAWVAIGTPSTGFDLYNFPVDFVATESAAWVSPDGGTLITAVLGSDDLVVGLAAL